MKSPYRMVLAALGLICVALGAVGAVVPGLPTTVFLILASVLFARSCPVLERRLLGLRLFRPYLESVRRGGGMTRRAKRLALAGMWTASLASAAWMSRGDDTIVWPAAAVLAAAAVGTAAVVRWPAAAGAGFMTSTAASRGRGEDRRSEQAASRAPAERRMRGAKRPLRRS